MSQDEKRFATLQGLTAVVTGASSGIGRAMALEFARGGANVVIHYAKSLDAATQVVAEASQFGVTACKIQAGLGAVNHEEFVQSVEEISGPVDVWVNNAGVDLLTGEGAQLAYEDKLTKLLEVDVAGSLHLSRAIGRRMKMRGSGVILNIGWDQADRGMEGDSAELFSTAKNAVMGATRSLAVSLAPEVRVNCIAPGWIQTAWGDQASTDWQDRVLRETPLKRWGQPEDIAKLARFLVSSDASYLTGQVINANGGAIR
ncbi:SDR family NAD(P)-dependent oxidoreductase [Thalassoglobus sp.]|uniref:SDR family NAD(P)-dependent oxidoreductase n=1 Tax=Thalassoglobus sp. TaxID=2795869 RepID=UPI003AA833D8